MIEVLIPTRPQMAIKMLEESPSQGGFASQPNGSAVPGPDYA